MIWNYPKLFWMEVAKYLWVYIFTTIFTLTNTMSKCQTQVPQVSQFQFIDLDGIIMLVARAHNLCKKGLDPIIELNSSLFILAVLCTSITIVPRLGWQQSDEYKPSLSSISSVMFFVFRLSRLNEMNNILKHLIKLWW